MGLISAFSRYPDHEHRIEHFEKVRFGDQPA